MIAPPDAALAARIAQLRRFDRFYAERIGRIRQVAHVNELTITELRVFQDLGEAGACSAAWLIQRLRLDKAYLSRILRKFRAYGFVEVNRCVDDRRRRELTLTPWGRRVFRALDEQQLELASHTLENLPRRQQERLAEAMKTIEEVLSRNPLDDFLERCREETTQPGAS